MKHELQAIIARHHVPADLKVTYGDIHGLGGGSTITIRGDGSVEYQANNQISEHELVAYISRLIELTAWEQLREPPLDSPPVPPPPRWHFDQTLTMVFYGLRTDEATFQAL